MKTHPTVEAAAAPWRSRRVLTPARKRSAWSCKKNPTPKKRRRSATLHKMEPKELENVPVPGLPAEALSERGVQVELFQ